MAYGDFKDLNIRTTVLRDKVFNIAKNPKYDGYEREIASMVYNFFYKVINYKVIHKFFETLATKNKSAIKNENVSSKELAEQLHKPSIRKFKNRKVHSTFIDNIWSVDLAYMQLISKFNKEFRFLLCVIDIYSKYT